MFLANWLFAALASVALSLEPEASAWQRHQTEFNFLGVTSSYTCDGLESKVRQILLFMGARNDLKVRANGCTRGPDALTHAIWVSVDFYSLVATDPPSAAQAVQARWTPLNLNAQRPDFMGRGDCELVDGMKQVLKQNFAWRGLTVQVDCAPHELSLDDFHVQGEVLMTASPN